MAISYFDEDRATMAVGRIRALADVLTDSALRGNEILSDSLFHVADMIRENADEAIKAFECGSKVPKTGSERDQQSAGGE